MEAAHPARALEREGADEPSSGYSLRPALGLHRSAGALDLIRHPLVEPLQAKPDPLRVLPRRERCRADQIGEKHGGQLSFLTNDRIFRHGWIVTPPHAPR